MLYPIELLGPVPPASADERDGEHVNQRQTVCHARFGLLPRKTCHSGQA